MNGMNEKMKKEKIAILPLSLILSLSFLSLSFLVMFSLSVASVSASASPVLRTDEGVPISSLGGIFIVDSSNYLGDDVLLITYNAQIHNLDDKQTIVVRLDPADNIKDYVYSPAVCVPPKSVKTLPLQVWIGGDNKVGKLSISYQFADGAPQYFNPFVYIGIVGKKISSAPPQLNGPQSLNVSNCGGVTNTNIITFPTPTEGKIALVCSRDDCNTKAERNIWILFRMKGWDVTGKSYKSWTASDLDKYDIIACVDEGSACRIGFNSTLYNEHFLGKKPFLEIPGSAAAQAAFSFDYVSKAVAKSFSDQQLVYNIDYITNGVAKSGIAVNGKQSFGVESKNINDEVKWIGNSSDGKLTTIFKVKESVSHSRYAYLGLFVTSSMSDLTFDGERIFNNTLKWLKYGDAYFGGSNDNTLPNGNIAFICSSDKCNSKYDIDFIKFLRKSGYSVSFNSLKNWLNVVDLSQYNVIICTSSKSCTIPAGSNIYNAHKSGGIGFVEIPDSGKISAASTFGYITNTKNSVKTKLSTTISSAISSLFFDGLTSPAVVANRNRGMVSLPLPLASSLVNGAVISYKGVDQALSTMFYVPDSGSQGRYIFIGWLGKFDKANMANNGKILLQRAINWANCNSIAC